MRREAWPLWAACLLYLALSAVFIPLAGLQADEALFVGPIYNVDGDLAVGLGRFKVSAMVMSYLGSVKSILYIPWLKIVPANVWTIRLPMVLLGLLTICVFYRLTSKAVGRGTAIAAAFLLASDPLFILTNAFDWGPVAIEHLLLVTGCYALYRFGHRNGLREPFWHIVWLAAGFFCFGLALWNKAIFSWALGGLVAATGVVLWKPLWRFLTPRHIATAVAAFLLGAAPLLYFNVRHDFATFRQNAKLAPEEIPGKWIQLKSALNGESLFGYIPKEEWEEPFKMPAEVSYRISEWVREAVGQRRQSYFDYILAGLLLLVPLWWRSRAAWFALVFSVVAWLIMAATHDAGGSGHHVVLLWPFPFLFAAVVLVRLPRWVGGTVLAAAVLLHLAVLNQYFYQFKRNGTGVYFTDAIFPLSDGFRDDSTEWAFITDWGIYEPLKLLHRGRLRMGYADFAAEKPTPEQVEMWARMLSKDKILFVGHVDGMEFVPDSNKHLAAFAASQGNRREVVRVIADSNGRPVFEISRIVPAQ